MKIRKGDMVLLQSGKDKGKKGRVLRVFPKEARVVVEEVNVRARHRKPRKQGEKGQIVHIASPVSSSSVMLLCTKCGKPTRIGFKTVGQKKYRVCKKCEGEI